MSARFGPIRSTPPPKALAGLGIEPGEGSWRVERLGDEGGFPNGGMWIFSYAGEHPSARVVVKRTGARHLGESRVWGGRAEPADPHWWGRESAFYASDLAVAGWSDDARSARCLAIDEHEGEVDLWLEFVDIPADSLATVRRAASGLARWQVNHADARLPWLSYDWIPTHVGRWRLDNARTLAHPAWGKAIERGLDPGVRAAVAGRVTDPGQVERRLAAYPKVLSHFDFHANNIGTTRAGEMAEVVLIDWAYAGWGPIGHDVGHLAMDLDIGRLGLTAEDAWRELREAYCEGLVAAGWEGDLEVVHRSMAESAALRLSWTIDHLLDNLDAIPDDAFEVIADRVTFLFTHAAEVGPGQERDVRRST